MSDFFPPIKPMSTGEKLGIASVVLGLALAFTAAAGGAGYHFGSQHEKNTSGVILPDCKTVTSNTVVSGGHTYTVSCNPK